MSNTPSQPFPTFVIGVSGGSGKSTVTREVLASVGASNAAVLMQDD
jgi:uridine kinase